MRRTTFLRPTIVFICIALFCLAGSASAQSDPQASASRLYLPILRGGSAIQSAEEQGMANRVLELINAERTKAGCKPLSSDGKLTLAAQNHSRDMATNDFFDHSGSSGSSVADRISAAGYSWRTVGENIAAGYSSPEAVVAGWMESAGHRRNILNCAYVHTGIGYLYQSDDAPLAGASWPYYRYWTQVFAAPR
jgi:uncharacterized protein YkwD